MKLPGRGQPDEEKDRPDPWRRGADRKGPDSGDQGWLNRRPVGGGSDRPGAGDDDFDFVRDRYGAQHRRSDIPAAGDKDEGSPGRFGSFMRRGGDEERKTDTDQSRGRLGARLGDLSGRREEDAKPNEPRARATGRFDNVPGRPGSTGRSSGLRGGGATPDKDDKSGSGLRGRFGRGSKDKKDEKKDTPSSRRGSSGRTPSSGRRGPFLRGSDDADQKNEPGGSALRTTGGLSRPSSFGSRDRSQPIGVDDQNRSSPRPGYPRDREDQPGGARPGYPRDREDQPGGVRPGYPRDREDQPGGVRPAFPRDREDQPGSARPGYLRDREDQPGGMRSSTQRDQFGATSRTSTYGDRAQPGVRRSSSPRDQQDTGANRPFSSPFRDRDQASGTGSTLRDRGTPGTPSQRDRPGYTPRSASQTRAFTPERRSTIGTGPDKKDAKAGEQRKSKGLIGRLSSRGKKEEEPKGGRKDALSARSSYGQSAATTTGPTRRSQPRTPAGPSTFSPAGRSTQTMRPAVPARVDDKTTGRRRSKAAEKPKTRAPSRAKPTPLPEAKPKGAFTTHQGLDLDRKIDLIGVSMVGFALVAFFAVIPSMSFGLLPEPQAGLTGSLNDLLSQIFGWGKIVWPVFAFGIGVWLMAHRFEGEAVELNYFRVIGVLSLYACVLTWLQMLELVNDVAPTVEAFKPISRDLAITQGRGGGWVGHEIYLLLLSQLLDWGTLSVLIAWLVMSLMLTFDLSVVELWGYVAGVFIFLRPNPEARARRKAAQEARTAEIVAAMRPGEETRQLPLTVAATAAAAGAAALQSKTQEAPAVETERKRFGLRRGGTVEETPTPVPDQPPARTAPAINRRGSGPEPGAVKVETVESAEAKIALLPVAADESADQESRLPERRRMPHLRRTQEMSGDVIAGESTTEPAPDSTTAAEPAEDKAGQGRFSFLRRGRGESDVEAEPDTAAEKEPAAALPRRAVSGEPVPGIPVPPRRRDMAAGPATPERRLPERPVSASPATPSGDGDEAKPTEEQPEQEPSSGRRRFMPGLRRPGQGSDEPSAAEEKKAGANEPQDKPAAERTSPFGRPARLEEPVRPDSPAAADTADSPGPDRPSPFRRRMPIGVSDDDGDDVKPADAEPGKPDGLGVSTAAAGAAGAAGWLSRRREESPDAEHPRAVGRMDRPRPSSQTPERDESAPPEPRPRPVGGIERPRPVGETAERGETRRESALPDGDVPDGSRPRRALPFRAPGDSESPETPPKIDQDIPAAAVLSPDERPARPESLGDGAEQPSEESEEAIKSEATIEPPARPRGIEFLRRSPGSRPPAGDKNAESKPAEKPDPADQTVRAEQPTVEAPAPTPVQDQGAAPLAAPADTAAKPPERRFLPQPGPSAPPREAAPRPAESPAASQGDASAVPQRPVPQPATSPQRSESAAPPQRTVPQPAASAPAQRTAPPPPTSVKPSFGRPGREPAAAVARGANAPESRFATPHKGKYELPDFTKLLRKGDERRINDEILLDKARVIEDTLVSFGAPGKVVEVNPGPVITQFGIEPSYLESRGGKRTRVKVGSIARLDADLALALAARSIRIEAPVPGKGYVGIEVPNDEVSLVGLLDIMQSPEFKRIDSKLKIALGLAVDGSPVAADLTAMPHLLIAGTTGSGKSVCVNAIIACLLLQNTPEDVQFIMVDPKRVELTGYNGIPHLVAPVVVDLERIVGVLQWVQREMEERYRKFASISARNILDYNNKIGPETTKMPYYIVVVDELADLMMLAPDETERLLARLAQMARATGIHLIISTQRPSVDIITGLIKANFPARIAFAVASSVDSRVILDQPGAEKLLGRGDMLYQSPDAAAPLRMQGVFVSDEEIIAITRYWRGTLLDQSDGGERDLTPSLPNRRGDITFNRTPPTVEEDTSATRRASKSAQPTLWEAGADGGDDENTAGEDELYDQAVDLVERLSKASISLLQRRLRIGYTRAARLIDRMEADGIVGPSTEGSKPREVLKRKGEHVGED
jgi:DNA segregation ATPase FtsK/SpoIIIE-like protein